MTFTLGFIIVGMLLVTMAMAGSFVERLPLSTSMLYVGVGAAIGPAGLALVRIDPWEHAEVLERVTEIAVIVSLFTAGLKLRLPLRDRRWLLTLRLAFGSMAITVGLVTLVGVWLLHMPLGLAVLLGGILAPTDPVLAGDVQVRDPGDRDRVRFGLTSEAGMNDGSAFPFVMLGLGLLGLHDLGTSGWRWFVVDVGWAVAAGLATGALLGTAIGQLVVYLRRQHREALGLDDFLALGLISLSYGVALLLGAYAFLSVFAAGLAVRRIEARSRGDLPPEDVRGAALAEEDLATHPEKAPAWMSQAVLAFNEQLDRIGTVAVLLLVGSMLSLDDLNGDARWFVPLLLLVIRPASVWLGLLGSATRPAERRLMAWFGVRGIGSVYYLMYAIAHGLPFLWADQLTTLCFAVVTTSVVVHGVSVTPLMNWYERTGDRVRRQQFGRRRAARG